MSDAKLKPCPFCGETEFLICRGQIVGTKDNGCRFVMCRGCGARTAYLLADNAVAAWNRRAPDYEVE